MESSQYLANFSDFGISLMEFLTITDSRLKDIGVELPINRKKILLGLLKFHIHPWAPNSIHMVKMNTFQSYAYNIYFFLVHSKNNFIYLCSINDIFLMLTGHLKHLIVLDCSLTHISKLQFNVQKNEKQLNNIIKHLREYRKVFNKLEAHMKLVQ